MKNYNGTFLQIEALNKDYINDIITMNFKVNRHHNSIKIRKYYKAFVSTGCKRYILRTPYFRNGPN